LQSKTAETRGGGRNYLLRDRRGEDCYPGQELDALAALPAAKIELEYFAFAFMPRGCAGSRRDSHAGLIELMGNRYGSTTFLSKSKGQQSAVSNLNFCFRAKTRGKDVRMPKTVAVVQLPEILRSKSSHLVKLAGKIDSFSLLLRETPDGELKRSIEEQFHTMVFATRKEIRKFCPRYRSLPGEGILDFNTDCTSGQLEPGDLGSAPPPKRGRLCETCCFFTGIPEEQAPKMTLTPAPQDLVLVV
jgi:hypothetical protein